MALLTIMGLYNYDSSIFENLYLPQGVDRSDMVNHIVLETAELECIYPVPSFLKSAIGLWSATRAMTWDRIYQASLLEYNPIENYDRQETETSTGTRAHSGKDTTTHSGTETHSGKDTTTHSGTETHSGKDTTTESGTETHSGKDTTTHSGTETHSGKDTTTISGSSQSNGLSKVAGFDSTTLVDHDSTTGSATNSGTEELTHGEQIAKSETNELTHGEQIADSKTHELTHGEQIGQTETHELTHGEQIGQTETHELTHGEQIADSGSRTSRIHGNIGVTTSQQMLEQELEVAPKLNMYDYIAEEFKKRFCILVY